MTATVKDGTVVIADLTCKAGQIAGGTITPVGPNLLGDQVLEVVQ